MNETKYHELPILDVHKENIEIVWPIVTEAIKASTYIGLDVGLSGLGAKSGLNSSDIEERYRAMVASAQTRSLLSLGISCFSLIKDSRQKPARISSPESTSSLETDLTSPSTIPNGVASPSLSLSDSPPNSDHTCDSSIETVDCSNGTISTASERSGPLWISKKSTAPMKLKFKCQTFNIFTLCQDDFIVEPDSLMFLVGHGFDFNLQFEKGLPYCHGYDSEKNKSFGDKSVRNLFCTIVASKKPIVLHNGILDLAFLYANLYAPLPPTLSIFISDLAEMFPAGIYDTKTFAEYKLQFDATYLSYVFRKLQRQNHDKALKGHIHVAIDFSACHLKDERLEKDLLTRDCSIREPNLFPFSIDRPVCDNFAAHGWCVSAHSCPLSHNIDDILDLEAFRTVGHGPRRHKRRLRSIAFDSGGTLEEDGSDFVSEHTAANGSLSSSLPTGQDWNFKIDRRGPRTSSTSSMGIVHNIQGHRAGYDAFMTAFAMACLMGQLLPNTWPAGPYQNLKGFENQYQEEPKKNRPPEQSLQHACKTCNLEKNSNISNEEMLGEDSTIFSGLLEFRNKLFLSRKDFQLIIAKTPYSKVSREHQKKMERLKLIN